MQSAPCQAPLCLLTGISIYLFVMFVVFMFLYVYNYLEEDFAPVTIFMWPIVLPILALFGTGKLVHKFWIIIGGPKIRRLSVDEREQERRRAHHDLSMAIYKARNAGVSDEEIARLARDSLIKDVMEC
jgi:hypothetical protein